MYLSYVFTSAAFSASWKLDQVILKPLCSCGLDQDHLMGVMTVILEREVIWRRTS